MSSLFQQSTAASRRGGERIMTSIGALFLSLGLSFFASPDKFAPINQLLNETYLESNNYN